MKKQQLTDEAILTDEDMKQIKSVSEAYQHSTCIESERLSPLDEALNQLGVVIDKLDKSVNTTYYGGADSNGVLNTLIFNTVADLRNIYTRLGGKVPKWRND